MATRSEIESAVLAALHRIAPEADLAHARRDADLRDELDIDSMDFLGFVTALCRTLGTDLPESDYPKLTTIEGAIAHFSKLLAAN